MLIKCTPVTENQATDMASVLLSVIVFYDMIFQIPFWFERFATFETRNRRLCLTGFHMAEIRWIIKEVLVILVADIRSTISMFVNMSLEALDITETFSTGFTNHSEIIIMSSHMHFQWMAVPELICTYFPRKYHTKMLIVFVSLQSSCMGKCLPTYLTRHRLCVGFSVTSEAGF